MVLGKLEHFILSILAFGDRLKRFHKGDLGNVPRKKLISPLE